MTSSCKSSRRLPMLLASIFVLIAMGHSLAFSQSALQFNGTNQYVTFGAATATLGAQNFTLECWFKRTGTGVVVTTGGTGATGGIQAIPLVTKGRGEADASTVDANYFLGINAPTGAYVGPTGVLAADMEEGASPSVTPGLNHPVYGVTVITNDVWYHAAVTYDSPSRRWRMYLNGNLEKDTVVSAGVCFPQYLSIQHAGLGTALNSTGVQVGYFAGVMDEVRIWNYARTQQQIQDNMSAELTSGTGLLGRWGLNDGSGTSAVNSISGSPAGTLTNGPTWTAMPTLPTAPSALTATAVSSSQINLGWTDLSSNEAAFEVQRSTDGGSTFTTITMAGVNSNSFNNTGLAASTQYWYRVRAINPNQGSAYTSTATATTLAPTPPAAPSGLNATAPSAYQINLGWTDNSNNETNFEIERSTTGIGGTYSLLATVGANTNSYNDLTVIPTSGYCYRVRATNGGGASGYAGPSCATTPAEGDYALDLGSASAYVTFGQAMGLATQNFTVEVWFKRTGAGTAKSTGSNGITLVPLLAKGSPEADGSNVDENYVLGIRSSDNVLAADFEEGTGSLLPGDNHPIAGTTPILNNVWYHAAAIFGNNVFRIYLNGNLEASLTLASTIWPQGASIQHAALGTMLTSTGATNGGSATSFFQGVLDEARIWNSARTQAQILATINSQITSPQSGLLARWGLNEGTGTNVNGSAGTSFAGTITGTGSSWITPGAPFNIVFTPPNAPSNLVVTPISNSVLQLNWSDNSTNETGFEIERSTSGPGGPFTPLGTVAANVVAYNSTGLDPLTNYCYRVRAVSGTLQSAYTSPACGTTPADVNNALDLGSAGSYVTFGIAPSVATPTFTVETWFKRTGTGTANTTGTGGIDIIPLVTKGSPEDEASTVDENYVLGIQSLTNVIGADFEEGTGSTSPGQNHPLVGTTPVTDNVWHHAAATFANGVFKIYLDGVLENTLNLGTSIWPQGASIQHAALGTMITSTGTANGKFQGVLDEARVWNYARTLTEIRLTINSQITGAQTGLLVRWGLNEGAGTVVSSSAGTTVDGTVTGTGSAWTAGAPFNLLNFPPNMPALNAPSNGATGVSTTPTLDVAVSDPDGGTVTVKFYGRPAVSTAATFSIVVLPDAQNYTSSAGGGLPATFTAQTQWCVNNKAARNIQYVSQVGDITNENSTAAWVNANTSMSLLDATPPGIPYGVILGNHDYVSPPTKYGTYFPASRFAGRSYYGGAYDANNENHYEFFNSDGMEFIVINLSSSDQNPATAVLNWADALLKTYSTKRGILVNHYVTETGNPAAFSTPGSTIYNALKNNPNLFLMLCGHVPGVGRRQDAFYGSTIYSVLADYQNETNGGNGWLRIMEFDPPNNQIHVTTYSPTLNQWKTDANNQFDIPYMMQPNAFQLIGTNSGVASGSNTTKTWAGLAPLTQYEWYATVSDGIVTTTSPTWTFTTASTHTITASAGPNGSISPSGAIAVPHNGSQSFTITPNSGYQIASVVVDGSPVGTTSPYVFSSVTVDHTIATTFTLASETVVCGSTSTDFPFPSAKVAMNFGVLPPGGGSVTVRRYLEPPPSPTYPDPPTGSTYIPVWFDITSTMANNSFNGTITVDVTDLTGFGAGSRVMCYNATSGRWVLLSGTYNSGAHTFTFSTTHFTAFGFINGLSTAYDVYLSSSQTSATAGIVYPNDTWAGGYLPLTNDWGYTGTQPFSLYIVPQNGTTLGACELVVQYDSAVVALDSVLFTGSIFSGPNLLYASSNRFGSGTSVTLNASLISPTNIAVGTGDYIAKLKMKVKKPGHGTVALIGDHVLSFNVGSSPSGVYVIPHQAEVKAYLGDVASSGNEATGDGKIDHDDLSPWSLSYWSGVPPVGMTNYKSKYDIGPTQDGYAFSLPTHDQKIDFEDLVIFAITYGQSARNELPKVPVQSNEPLVVSLGKPEKVGDELRVPVLIGGGVTDVRAMKLELNGQFGSFLGVDKGELLRSYETPVMLMNRADGHRVYVDLAVMGLDAQSVNREGEVVVLRFAGTTSVSLVSAECRSSWNTTLGANLSRSTVGTMPTKYNLGQNYPNPFNPTTTIDYEIPVSGKVTLEVYTILGVRAATLVNDVQDAGFYQVMWDGRDENHNAVATGVYLYRVRSGEFSCVKKMLLVK